MDAYPTNDDAFVLQTLDNSAFDESAIKDDAFVSTTSAQQNGDPDAVEAASMEETLVRGLVTSRLTTLKNERLRNWNEMFFGKYGVIFSVNDILKRITNNITFYSLNYLIILAAAMCFCSFFSLSFFMIAVAAAGSFLYFCWWRTTPLVVGKYTIPMRAIQIVIGLAAVVLLFLLCGPIVLIVFSVSVVCCGVHSTLKVSHEESVEDQFQQIAPV